MVQRVAATTQWTEQVPIGYLELGAGSILPGTQTAVAGGGGGAEVWLDGEQMGIVCRGKDSLRRWHIGVLTSAVLDLLACTGVLGAGAPYLLCWV